MGNKKGNEPNSGSVRVLNDIVKLQDDDGHWYWVPKEIASRFNDRLSFIIGKDYIDCPYAFDDFSDKYEIYRTLGDSDLMPDHFKIIENQIGCGYCKHEKNCPDRDPEINKAKLGCEKFIHHEK